MIGKIHEKADISGYQPPQPEVDLTKDWQGTYEIGHNILNRSWQELDNLSVIECMNEDKRDFNSNVPPPSLDPDDAWKWRGTRATARKKMMATYAHLTSAYVVPSFFAQNDKDEDDKDFAEVMKDCVQWLINNSNYLDSYLLAVMGALVNPVTYVEADWCEIYQTIKEKLADGTLSKKEVLDEVLSGFNANVLSADQVMITNAHQQNIQRQYRIMKRRFVEKSELDAKYRHHKNWVHVHAGIRSIFNPSDGLFYDIKDDMHPTLVEEVIGMCRSEDLEIPWVNGIYLGDDDLGANPMKHRDNNNAPKYNLVPFGAERINEHFFFFKSGVRRVHWDHILIDQQWENAQNAATMAALPSVAITGDDEIDTQVMMPSAVTAFASKDVKVTPISVVNPAPLFAAMDRVQDSAEENSVSEVQGGALPQASQKAYNVARAEQNGKINLGPLAKSLGSSVAQLGQLMSDIVINHVSVPEIDEIEGGKTRLKYRKLLIHDAMVDGKKVSKLIRFSDALIGKEMTPEEKKAAELDLMIEHGGYESKKVVKDVNPFLFSKRKYLAYCSPDEFTPPNKATTDAMKMDAVDKLGASPYLQQFIDGETFVEDFFLGIFAPGDEEKYKKQIANIMGAPALSPSPMAMQGAAQGAAKQAIGMGAAAGDPLA